MPQGAARTDRQGHDMTDTAVVVTGAGIERIRVFLAKQALDIHIRTNGEMQATRNGTRNALAIVSGYTGKTYKRSMAGKREALADALALLGE